MDTYRTAVVVVRVEHDGLILCPMYLERALRDWAHDQVSERHRGSPSFSWHVGPGYRTVRITYMLPLTRVPFVVGTLRIYIYIYTHSASAHT